MNNNKFLPNGYVVEFGFTDGLKKCVICSHTEESSYTRAGYEIRLPNGNCIWVSKKSLSNYEDDYYFNNNENYEQLSLF